MSEAQGPDGARAGEDAREDVRAGEDAARRGEDSEGGSAAGGPLRDRLRARDLLWETSRITSRNVLRLMWLALALSLPGYLWEMLGPEDWQGEVSWMISWLAVGALQAALTAQVLGQLCGRPMNLGDGLIGGLRHGARVVPLALLTHALLLASVILLGLPFFFAAPVLAVVVPCAVLERRSLSAFGRAAYLTRGQRGMILRLMGVLLGLEVALELVLEFVKWEMLQALFAPLPVLASIATRIAGILLYIRLREQVEGVSPEELDRRHAGG